MSLAILFILNMTLNLVLLTIWLLVGLGPVITFVIIIMLIIYPLILLMLIVQILSMNGGECVLKINRKLVKMLDMNTLVDILAVQSIQKNVLRHI